MTSIKKIFHSLFFSDNIPPVNIVDGISFTVCGKEIIYAPLLCH